MIHLSSPNICPSRRLFDQYTAPGVQLPYQLCFELFWSRNLEREKHPEENGWMLAGDDRVCLSPVSLQTSTSCRLGTDQMWLQDILQGSLLMQEE